MRDHSGRRSAFTMIELLVVMSILVVLASLLVTTIIIVKERIMRGVAKAEMSNMATAIQQYHNQFYAYPPDSGDWGQGDISDPETLYKCLVLRVKDRNGKLPVCSFQ